jgi:hypothetical protein
MFSSGDWRDGPWYLVLGGVAIVVGAFAELSFVEESLAA